MHADFSTDNGHSTLMDSGCGRHTSQESMVGLSVSPVSLSLYVVIGEDPY